MEPRELIDEYLRELDRELRAGPLLRRRMVREAREHLTDLVAEGREAGLPPLEAARAAIARFGPARAVAERFPQTRRARPLVAAVVLVTVAAVVLLATAPWADRGAVVASGPDGAGAKSTRLVATPQPALVLVQRFRDLRSWRLDDRTVFRAYTGSSLVDVRRDQTTARLTTVGDAVLAPDGTQLAVVGGEFELQVLDAAGDSAVPSVALGARVTERSPYDPRQDTLVDPSVLSWPLADRVFVLVSARGPRNRLRSRELLVVEPGDGIRARVDLTRFGSLIAQAATSRSQLLLLRIRNRGSGPYVLVEVDADGDLRTLELRSNLVTTSPRVVVDRARERVIVVGRAGRVAEIDLRSFTLRERRVAADIVGTAASILDGGSLPVVAQAEGAQVLTLGLLDTEQWVFRPFTELRGAFAIGSGSIAAAGGLVVADGAIGASRPLPRDDCLRCGNGVAAYDATGRPVWRALGVRRFGWIDAGGRYALVALRLVERGEQRNVLLDAVTGRAIGSVNIRAGAGIRLVAP